MRFFVSARTCRQQTLPLLDAARTHASLEPQPIALLRRSTNLQATDASTAPCCSNTCISGTASYSNIRTPLAVAHNVAVVLPEALTEPEAGVGTESVRLGGSFWIRLRLEKAVAGPGVRGQDDRDKWKQTSFFLGIQRRRLAPKVRPWEARFGPELDWEKLWRDQVFGAKMTETNGNKLVFF